MSERLSKYVSWREGIKSNTASRLGIDNTPNEEQIKAMKHIAKNIFDPVREFVGGPLHVNSFYRSPILNRSVGGSSKSQHCKGEAMDIDCDQYGHGTNAKVFHFIKDNLEYDQLIWEFGNDQNPEWIHVSLTQRRPNRKSTLISEDRDWETPK